MSQFKIVIDFLFLDTMVFLDTVVFLDSLDLVFGA